ncbi:MAG: hypothetical protein M0D55_13495 [Elusimicrobiota bacterium]|nr:MAG: hypothetical protein M0D55_13495 [Elusimicrobiota bacterium]
MVSRGAGPAPRFPAYLLRRTALPEIPDAALLAGAPWWFYFAVLPAGLLPWTAPALAGFQKAAARPFSDPRATALALWILGVAGFFTTSHSKLATYVLPVLPHACLLGAAALEDGLPAWARRLSRVLGVLLLLAAAAGVLLWLRLPHLDLSSVGAGADVLRPAAALGAAFFAALGSAQLLAPSARRPALALGAGAVLGGALVFGALRAASPLISARDLALAVGAEARPGDEVWTYDSYLHGLPFYSGRRVDKMVYFVGEFHYAKRDADAAQRFGDDGDVRRLPRAGEGPSSR